MSVQDDHAVAAERPRVGWLAALFVAELIAVAVLYQFFAQIECHLTDAQATCDFLRSLVARALVVLAVVAILIRARPATFAQFFAAAQKHEGRKARGFHLIGVALLLVPLVMAADRDLGAMFDQALVPWGVGAVAAAGGGLLWVAPASAWMALIRQDHYAPLPILLAAALIPDLANGALPLWDWQALTTATFVAVAGFLRLFVPDVTALPAEYVIGVDTFLVHIARQCSGVEGFALVTAFVGLYAFVFRHEVRLVRFLLVVLPLGLMLSWGLNVVRIGTLILIGAGFSPEVAVNGFHSYAGWLFFTLLAFGLIWFVQSVPGLHHRGNHGTALPVRRDPVAAAILPFVAFMVASTFVAAVIPVPGIGFPLITVVLVLSTALFLPLYRQIAWRPDPLAIGAGLGVGIGWIALAPMPDLMLEGTIAGMPMAAFVVWAVLRVAGTALFVPLIEEMFFRGYMLTRLDGPQPWRRALAVVLTSLAFGALHGRWAIAGVAGVVFALVYLRRGRIGDAIWAHVVANSVVAASAVLQREWSLI